MHHGTLHRSYRSFLFYAYPAHRRRSPHWRRPLSWPAQTGVYRRIAIVCAEIASRGLNWQDHESSLIFGDGAAAVIVEQGDGRAACVAYRLEVHPQGRDLCEIRAGGTRRNPRMGLDEADHYFRMQGKPVFKLASQLMPAFMQHLFAELDYKSQNIDVVVPHQASHLAMQHIKSRLGLGSEQIIDIYATHGNQVAASIPTALHEAFRTGRARHGQKMLLIGTNLYLQTIILTHHCRLTICRN